MTDIPEDVMNLAAKVVDDAEAECRKERYLFGFPTAHGKETLDKHIARAIMADRAAQAERIRELEEDAARYRWLRDNEGGRSNRWPHVTQYPYQPEIDRFRPPQIMRDMQYRGEYLDEAIDAARAAPPEHLLSAHACSLLRAKEETPDAR